MKTNLKLTPFDSELWDILHGAYGNVCEEVRILMGDVMEIPPQMKIRRLDFEEKNDYQITFDNLCENLTHQMSFYDASYLTMPYLVTLLEQKEAEQDSDWQFSILCNLGICLATDIYENNESAASDHDKDFNPFGIPKNFTIPKEIIDTYNISVEILQEKTKFFIKTNLEKLKNLEEIDKNFFATAVLAILGDRKTAHIMCLGGWEQPYFLCKKCDTCIENVEFSDKELCEMITPAPESEQAWDGEQYDSDTYTWYHGFLQTLEAKDEAKILSLYYGEFTCPECGAKGKTIDFAKAYLLD